MTSFERAAVKVVAQDTLSRRKVLRRAHLRWALRDKDDSVCSQQRPRGLVEERHLHIRANTCVWSTYQ